MKKIFVSEITENEVIDSLFLVKNKNLSTGKTGKAYLSLSLMDKTGDIDGKIWDDAEKFSQLFDTDNFVRVRAKATSYMGKLQLKVGKIKAIKDSEVDASDFLPTASSSPEEMFLHLQEVIESVKDKHLQKLLLLLAEDNEISANLKKAPAAKGMHHVYLGGLLEHILSLCSLIDVVSSHYGQKINRDLLITGAILHDIGKTRELSYSRAFGYTDEGRLLGHITIGVGMVEEKIRDVEGFPQELSMLLKHMILSHHGEYEYGSPKRPKTLEATILSYLDDLDAKVNSLQVMIDSDSENGSKWTGYHRLYERYIYKNNFLSDGASCNELDEKKESVGVQALVDKFSEGKD